MTGPEENQQKWGGSGAQSGGTSRAPGGQSWDTAGASARAWADEEPEQQVEKPPWGSLEPG